MKAHLCPEMNPVAKFTNFTIFHYTRAKITNFTFFSCGDAKITNFTNLFLPLLCKLQHISKAVTSKAALRFLQNLGKLRIL